MKPPVRGAGGLPHRFYIVAMGGALFSIGDEVRVTGGSFVGLEGVVVPSRNPNGSPGAITVAAMIDGHAIELRYPPEHLERIVEPGREAGG